MCFGLKKLGVGFEVKEVLMDFCYVDLVFLSFFIVYECLLLDVMKGDVILFVCIDVVYVCWKFV